MNREQSGLDSVFVDGQVQLLAVAEAGDEYKTDKWTRLSIRTHVLVYTCIGVTMAVSGFYSIIRLMANDTVCVIL